MAGIVSPNCGGLSKAALFWMRARHAWAGGSLKGGWEGNSRLRRRRQLNHVLGARAKSELLLDSSLRWQDVKHG